MTVVERLEAAIAKLEQLKADGTLGPWNVDMIPETGECRVVRFFEFFGSHLEEVTNGGSIQPDADLIVTLHRTIDAQLAILKAAREDFAKFGRKPSEFFDNDLALADAILGDNS